MADSLARKKGIIVEETDLWDGSAPHDEASRWDAMDFLRDIEPTVAPWAAMKRPVGTEGKRVVLLNVTSR